MKIRLGFVSNSSSSSFVVIGEGKYGWRPTEVIIGLYGETEFGWGPEVLSDFFSRLNFAVIQTFSVPEERKEKWYSMILQALESEGIKVLGNLITEDYISWSDPNTEKVKEVIGGEEYEKVWGYIDHQSNSGEGKNTEIFDSLDLLKAFLFADGSRIELDNDNY